MNPERTGRRVINIDIENNAKKIRIQGAVQVILAELSFVVSFLFMFLMRKGYNLNKVREVIQDAVNQGLNKGWETYKKTEGIKGQDLYYQKFKNQEPTQFDKVGVQIS